MTEVQKSKRLVDVDPKVMRFLKRMGNKKIRRTAKQQIQRGEEVFTNKNMGFTNWFIT